MFRGILLAIKIFIVAFAVGFLAINIYGWQVVLHHKPEKCIWGYRAGTSTHYSGPLKEKRLALGYSCRPDEKVIKSIYFKGPRDSDDSQMDLSIQIEKVSTIYFFLPFIITAAGIIYVIVRAIQFMTVRHRES